MQHILEYYTVRKTEHGYRVLKFDGHDLSFQREYAVTRTNSALLKCSCFRKERETCRHRYIICQFVSKQLVDTGWFYCYDYDSWKEPVGDTNG